jgi:F0F1-type ATP synthase gamma subunit
MNELNTITISVDEYDEMKDKIQSYKHYNLVATKKINKYEKKIDDLRDYIEKLKEKIQIERNKKWYQKIF